MEGKNSDELNDFKSATQVRTFYPSRKCRVKKWILKRRRDDSNAYRVAFAASPIGKQIVFHSYLTRESVEARGVAFVVRQTRKFRSMACGRRSFRPALSTVLTARTRSAERSSSTFVPREMRYNEKRSRSRSEFFSSIAPPSDVRFSPVSLSGV